MRSPAGVLTLWELVSERWKRFILFCDFEVDGIDALNNWKPDLGHKAGYCGPQRPKRGQKSVGQCVRIYVCIPPVFRNHKSQTYEIRNLSSIYARRVQQAFGWNRSNESWHLHERFLFISKTALTIFFEIGVLIKCYELLVVYKF